MKEYIRVSLPSGEMKHYFNRRLVAKSLPDRDNAFVNWITAEIEGTHPNRIILARRGEKVRYTQATFHSGL